MSRICVIAVVAALLIVSFPALAEDYPGAKIVAVAKGEVVFEKDSKTEKFLVSPTMKVFNAKGE
jgi:hypothetical protein